MPYIELKEQRKKNCKDCTYFDEDRPKLCIGGLYTYIERYDGKRTYAASGCNWYGNDKREIYKRKMEHDRRHTSSYRMRARNSGYAID